MKSKTRALFQILVAVFLLTGLLFGMPARHFAKAETLSEDQKNSTYGFFVWLSENAKTEGDREDAKVAAQILKGAVDSAYAAQVFNNGTILGRIIPFATVWKKTVIGGENDATSLANFRGAINQIIRGNEYRAKESLAPLKISSALMAMSELNANYQDWNSAGHTNTFFALENLAGRQLEGTWRYGSFPGRSDNPYEGWYTEEKNNYDTNNGGETGHYETLTDRKGRMILTGFGYMDQYSNQTITASDGKPYECVMHNRLYSQHFSDDLRHYSIGNGFTPEQYLACLDTYENTQLGQGHVLKKTNAKAATCTTDGNTEYYTCTECGKIFSDAEGKNEIAPEQTTVKAPGHNWSEAYTVDKTATCTEEGSKSHHCTRCGKSDPESVQKIDKAKHRYGEWKTVTVASCEKDGLRKKTCSVCGDTVEKTIAALGHDWSVPVYEWSEDYRTAAVTRTCSRRDLCEVSCVQTRAEVTKPATCEEKGETTYTAEFSEDDFEDQTITVTNIDALGHDWSGEYTIDKAATCAEEGSRSHHCERCGKSDRRSARRIALADHTPEYVSEKEPSYTEDGCSAGTKCSVCGKILSGCEVIPKLTTLDQPDPQTGTQPDPQVGTQPDPQTGAQPGTQPDPQPTVQPKPMPKQPAATPQNSVREAPQQAEQETTQLQAPEERITIAWKPALGKIKAAKGKITVSWKKIKKTKKTKALLNQIRGVEVQYSTDPSFREDAVSVMTGKKKTKLVIKGLQKGVVCHVRVRYLDGSGGYSPWSDVKSARTK